MTGPQIEILEATERVILVEGSPRSAKSWGVAFKIWLLCWTHPGIQVFYCRYKDEDVFGQLRDLWLKVCAFFPAYLQPTWHAQEGAYDFPNKSRVYMRSLKVSTEALIHSKYKGLTLAVVVIEEASEVLERNIKGLKERLSQSRTPEGTPYPYPLQIVLVTNCVDEDHHLAKMPTTSGPDYKYIRADIHSNRGNLGEAVIAGYEADYPPGHPERRTVIEGRRGVTLKGTPVYARQFKRDVHLYAGIQFNPFYPLLEGWDFGEEKPAVVWMQYITHLAALRILGAVKGSELFLETFAPKVKEIRARLFPHARDIRSHCDPSGATGNGGMQQTPVTLLHQLQIPVLFQENSNTAPTRYLAIQTIGGYMLRTAVDGSPAFLMAPKCIELVWQGETLIEQESDVLATAFEAGYIWDDKAPSDAHPNVRKPKKRTRYDDLMNAGEYIAIGERIPLAPTVSALANATASYQTAPQRMALKESIEAKLALRKAQRDDHPIDGPRRGAPVSVRGRSGRRTFY
jgi:hypothetical protein